MYVLPFFFLFPASTVARLARGSALFSERERERVYLLSALNYALTPLVNNPHLRRRFDMGQAKRLQSTEYLSNLNYPVEVSSSSVSLPIYYPRYVNAVSRERHSPLTHGIQRKSREQCNFA